ncbi:MAG: DNA replication/repair protein RecF [Halorhodospira sp.]
MEELTVHGFRNLADACVHPHPRLNVVIGPNGAGKTSLLEAIFFLARVRSFRTRRPERLIRWGASEVRVTGRRGGDRIGVGYSSGQTRLRLNGAEAPGRSSLAERLPVQVINTEHQRLILDGPRVRRQFLDWGTFHMEVGYRTLALRYHQALRQRNAALRSGDQRTEKAWTPVLIEYAEALDAARARFVKALQPDWETLVHHWLGLEGLQLRYQRGAPKGGSWAELFAEQQARDWAQGFTGRGPHRADLVLSHGRLPAADALSRGQQKLLVVALLIAEIRLWAERGLAPVLLIDDLPAELDPQHLQTVLETVSTGPGQVFLSAIDAEGLPACLPTGNWYTLHQGTLATMV